MSDPTRDRTQVTELARKVLHRRPWDRADWHRLPARWLRDSLRALPTPTNTAADEQAFFPRDPELALLQAQLDEQYARHNPPIEDRAPHPVTRWLQWLPPRLYHPFVSGLHLEAGVDPEWAKTFLELVFLHRTARMQFPRPGTPAPTTLDDHARVILVSDWGTGAPFALQVADQIRQQLDAAGDRATHLIHLGDVYYAGTSWEAQHRFLDHWPVTSEDTKTSSWCLNGNHDMYAAGTGLFGHILTDHRFRAQRTPAGSVTSQLHLRNQYWQILGLDTSWRFLTTDAAGQHGHLDDEQLGWLREQTAPAVASLDPRPRTILLSHHPAFTVNKDGIEPDSGLLPVTAPLRLAGHQIDAWFWGHLHRLIKYTTPPDLGIDYAVCTGHGAVPEYAQPTHDADASQIETRFTKTVDDGDVTWYRSGFTVLDFARDRLTVTYIDLEGAPWGPPEEIPSHAGRGSP